MLELEAITPLEQEGYASSPERLAEAFRLLMERWNEGARDRETVLRLLFLTWYDCADPPFLPAAEPRCSIEELFRCLGGEASADGEFLYAMGVMAQWFPYCCGASLEWERRAPGLLARSAQLLSGPPAPERFAGRGAYGEYFEHVARGTGRSRSP